MGSRELRVGLFLVVMSVVLALVTARLAGWWPFAPPGRVIEVALDDSGGVARGAAVRVRGVDAGRVLDLTIRESGDLPVRLRVQLEEWVSLRGDATARTTRDGLLGSVFLALDPGRGEPVTDAGEMLIEGTPTLSMDEVMALAADLSVTGDQMLRSFEKTVADLQAALVPTLEAVRQAVSDETVDELRSTLTASRNLMAELESEVGRLADRFDQVGAGLQETNAGVQPVVTDLRDLVGSLQQALGADGEHLRDVLKAAERTLVAVDPQEGELASVLQELDAVLGNLREITDDVRARPSRLIGLGGGRDRKPGDPQ